MNISNQKINGNIFDLDESDIGKKIVIGIKALLFKQLSIQVISLIGSIVLAIILNPEHFGVFISLNFIISFLFIFIELGLGMSIVQHKDEPIKEELHVMFTIQLIIAILLIVILYFISPLFRILYPNLTIENIWLMRVLSVSLLLFTLKIIPLMLLERHLEFNKIAIIEICEIIIFQLIAIVFALLGYGVWSFVIAILCKAFIGLIITYLLKPWRLGFNFKLNVLKKYTVFAIPFQGNTLLSTLNASIIPLYLGSAFGFKEVGYVNWANNLGLKPQQLIDLVKRVVFPASARLQENKMMMRNILEESLRYSAWIIFLYIAIVLSLSYPITKIIYTDKWLPGVSSLNLYLLALIPISMYLIPREILLGIGKSRLIFNISIIATIIIWILSIYLTPKIGIIGIPVAFIITNLLGAILIVYNVKKVINLKFMSSIMKPLIALIIVCCFGYILSGLISNIFQLILIILLLIIFYVLLMILLEGKENIRRIILLFISKKNEY